MAFMEENDFCSLEEYSRHREARTYSTSLELNGLYTAMTRLQGGSREAVKFAVRLENLAYHTGLASVRFAFLDDNLETTHSAGAFVREDGIVAAFDDGVHVIDVSTNKNFSIRESYLRDYFDDQFGGILEQSSALQLQ